MIRPALISLALATAASASPMDREAHVYTPDMTLGEAMELGIVPEPVMQPQACADFGPWFCAPERQLALPKLPTEEPAWLPASGLLTYPDNWRDPAVWGAPTLWGGWIGGGNDYRNYRGSFETRTTHHHHTGCPCGCCDAPEIPEEPAPVPLPGAAWLLIGALGLLWRMRR